MPQELSPLQALQILDQVSSLAHVSREDHMRVQQSGLVLKEFIESHTEPQDETLTASEDKTDTKK